jgi:tetratricopeptide (TPR) repeat protein
VSETKSSGSEGGPHVETASSAVTTDRQQVRRRRVLALTGLWLLLAGLLTALSLVVVVLAASALMLVVGIAAGGLRRLRRYPLRHWSRTALDSTGRTFTASLSSSARAARGLRIAHRLRGVGHRARDRARSAPGRSLILLDRIGQAYARAVYRLFALGRRREALRLNEHGAQLRREGNPEEAVEQHRVALAIVRDLGDQEAEAMTLNNLGLALAQGGAERDAVQHLEQAVSVLRELGEEEREGQVIANLGIVHRRQGHSEEAANLLQEALDKLPPESSAYRQVEEQLIGAR